jgi:photolyase PhrII
MNPGLEKLLDDLPLRLRERVRSANGQPVGRSAMCVLYWMRTAVRGYENPALDVAVELANRLNQPVFVYHALSERYPYASDRHHTFMLEGAQDVQRQLAKRGIGYGCHVERPGHRGPHLRTLVQQASLTITEEMPVEPLRRWTARLARESDIPLLAVDTACVVPMQIVGKAHARAFEFRKATKDHYSQWLTLPAHEAEPAVVSAQLKLPFEPVDFHTTTIADLVSECEIDHAIGPVPHTVGGSTAGYQRWNRFMHRGLSRYARVRNDALLDGVSRMSAYLHHGMVSPQRVAREAAESNSDGAQKYLDELLIWRELAHGFCFYRPDHGRLGALPQWAIETLAEHQCDERPALHSWETMARAQTGDALWDAAQQSLLMHGELHNNVRMTWGKAILNWTPDARSALATIVDLNHRYALDGQDPASVRRHFVVLGAI